MRSMRVRRLLNRRIRVCLIAKFEIWIWIHPNFEISFENAEEFVGVAERFFCVAERFFCLSPDCSQISKDL